MSRRVGRVCVSRDTQGSDKRSGVDKYIQERACTVLMITTCELDWDREEVLKCRVN